MAARTRVKVNRLKLIEAIKSRRKEAEAKYGADREKSYESAESYADACVAALGKAINAAEDGKIINTDQWGKNTSKTYRLSLPAKPVVTSAKFDGSRYDRDTRILEMSDEETIALSTEDFDRYVK